MKKNLFVFFLTAVMVLSLAGAAAAAEKVTVTWWHTFTEGQKDTLEEIIAEFNAAHDDIEVVAESQPLDGFEAKVYEAVSNGTGPDIIFNYASQMPEYVDNGLAPDMNKYLSTDYKSRVPAGVYDEDTSFSDNGLHAMAVQTTGPIFYYNKTIFDELGLECPQTWDDVTEASRKIYEAKGIPGFAFDSLTDGFQTLLMQSGGEYVDVENKKVLFNTPEFEAIVQWFADGVQAGYFSLAPTTGTYFTNDMDSKVIASYVGSSAHLPYLNLGDDELAAAPMPKTYDGVDWVPGWNRSALVFASNEAQEKAAVEFVEYFTNAENAARWAISVVAFTPYRDAAELPEFQEFVAGNIALNALREQLNYAYVLPSFTGANTVRNEIKYLVQRAATGQMSAAEAIAEAVANCEEAMND
ncbi:MAG: extracellular solute-binding protein [Anaerolineaceae bacterium]|nr:extracellular solute-binding protein [Anaerolineaceae bacterium]